MRTKEARSTDRVAVRKKIGDLKGKEKPDLESYRLEHSKAEESLLCVRAEPKNWWTNRMGELTVKVLRGERKGTQGFTVIHVLKQRTSGVDSRRRKR